MSSNRRKAGPSAKLILINGKSYEKERGRQVTRYRFSETTLRRISRRKALRQGFLTELEEEVAELGWLFFRLGPDFAVIDLTKSSTWTKLGAKRLKEEGLLDADDDEIDRLFKDLLPDEPEDPEDE